MSDLMDGGSSAILFQDASRVNSKVLMAVIGASGTGKTPIALQLARGVIGPKGKLFVIGTEGDRALFYADRIEFKHVRMFPPYSPDRTWDYMEAAAKQGADAIVLDSGSDVFEGLGGEKEMAAASTLKPPLNWAFPKLRYRKLIQRMINLGVHIFITIRADEKIELIDDPDKPGKQKIVPKGWTPIWDKMTPYWMQVSLMLVPGPNLGDMAERRFYRCDDDLRPLFLRPGRIDATVGAELGAWLNTGSGADRRVDSLRAEAIESAQGGTKALLSFWDTLSREDKLALKPDMAGLKSAAEAVTAERERLDAEPPADDAADDRSGPFVSDEFWDRQSYEIPVLFDNWGDWQSLFRAHIAASPNDDCVEKLRDDNTETIAAYGAKNPTGYRELMMFISSKKR